MLGEQNICTSIRTHRSVAGRATLTEHVPFAAASTCTVAHGSLRLCAFARRCSLVALTAHQTSSEAFRRISGSQHAAHATKRERLRAPPTNTKPLRPLDHHVNMCSR